MISAVIELMGHRTHLGRHDRRATLLRIEHPTLADHTGEEPLTEMYAPAAIFSIRPCSQEEATAVAAWAWTRPITGPRVPEIAAAYVDDDDDDIVDAVIHDADCANSDGPCTCDAGF